MDIPSKRPEQKHTLTEAHRLARYTLKRFGLVGAGILAGISLPVVAIASQSSPVDKAKNTSKTQVHNTSSTKTSPSSGEVFSTFEIHTNTSSDDLKRSEKSSDSANVDVSINGNPVPLVNGSATEHIANSDASNVDINISIDSSSHSSNSSSSSVTDISIDSTSSSRDADSNTVRGSPRR